MTAILALRRRTHVERRTLALVRGGPWPIPPGRGRRRSRLVVSLEPLPAHSPCFEELRRIAAASGIIIQAPTTPYVSEGERELLAWLAEAQRQAYPRTAPTHLGLAGAMTECANALKTV